MTRKTTTTARLLPLALLLPLATACGGVAGADDSGTVTVTVGYQSKTINTVTAGTLLRSLGYFEEELAERGKRDGKKYEVKWQDYATGAPITAQMTTGRIDIGSMGDYPLLINAARGKQLGQPTRLVSVTGYNLRGGLNTVVTRPGSALRSLSDLRGKKVSTSVGPAADGTLIRALERAGLDPDKDTCGTPAPSPWAWTASTTRSSRAAPNRTTTSRRSPVPTTASTSPRSGRPPPAASRWSSAWSPTA